VFVFCVHKTFCIGPFINYIFCSSSGTLLTDLKMDPKENEEKAKLLKAIVTGLTSVLKYKNSVIENYRSIFFNSF